MDGLFYHVNTYFRIVTAVYCKSFKSEHDLFPEIDRDSKQFIPCSLIHNTSDILY